MAGTSVVIFEPGVWLFIFLGLLVGILFGFFGLGGSFFVTPALLVLGHPAKAAVGSGLMFVFGTSITAVATHRSLGHIDYKLGLLLILGMTSGIEVGKRFLFALASIGVADITISVVYVGLLAAVGLFVLRNSPAEDPGNENTVDPTPIRWIGTLQLPPVLTFKSGTTTSVWAILLIGFVTGSLAGILGVGGGFLILPSLMYGLALPEAIAVGTDIFQIAVSSGFGTLLYLQADAVHLSVVIPLLGGSIFGSYIGSKLTDFVDEAAFKQYFAAMLLIDSIAVASKTISHAYGIAILHTVSLILLFGTALIMSFLVVSIGVRNRLNSSPL